MGYRQRPVSQNEVAAACGLSEMTVSRVLRGQAGVSAANVEKVRAAASELGYVPNRIAGALAGAQVQLVAVIVPSLSNMVFPEVLMGLSAGLADSGLQPVLGLGNYDAGTEEQVLAELLAWRPSAVVLTGLDHSERTRAMLLKAAIPVVEIMDSDGAGIDCVVGLSQRAVGRQMGQAVVAAGHRNAVLLRSAQQSDRRQESRFNGFVEALAAADVPVLGSLTYDGPSSLPKGRALAAKALSHWPEVEFLYCTNDMIAAGALFALQAAGRKIPAETGLAGFSGLEILAGLSPRITTTDTRRFEIGQSAGRMILARLAGAAPGQRQEIMPHIDVGDTLKG
jgi:LacI family transcriptional regulator, gluconate utilization system Gnt-I transcriptional repressor